MGMKRSFKQRLFRLARTGLGAWILGWILRRASFLIPAERLLETDTLVAFPHPVPSYPLHIVILPKGRLSSMADLPTADGAFEADLFRAVNQLIGRFELASGGYRLIANGGKAQEVKLLHFHLISEDYHDQRG